MPKPIRCLFFVEKDNPQMLCDLYQFITDLNKGLLPQLVADIDEENLLYLTIKYSKFKYIRKEGWYKSLIN